MLGSVSGWGWIGTVASGALDYAVAFGFYLAGRGHVSASIAATFLTLIPVFGISVSYLMLGEHLGVRQRTGAVLVVGAVAAVTLVRSGTTRR